MGSKEQFWKLLFLAIASSSCIAAPKTLTDQDVTFLLNGDEHIPEAVSTKNWYLHLQTAASPKAKAKLESLSSDASNIDVVRNSEWWKRWKEFSKRSSLSLPELVKGQNGDSSSVHDDSSDSAAPPLTYFIQDVDRFFLKDSIIRDDERTPKIEHKTLRERLNGDVIQKNPPNNISSNGTMSTVEYVNPGVRYVISNVQYIIPKVEYSKLKTDDETSHVTYVKPNVKYIEPHVQYENQTYTRNNSIVRRTPLVNFEILPLYIVNDTLPRDDDYGPMVRKSNSAKPNLKPKNVPFIENVTPMTKRNHGAPYNFILPPDITKIAKPIRNSTASHMLARSVADVIRNSDMSRRNDDSAILEHSIPGVPNQDYPVWERIPATGFKCNSKAQYGYYADVATGCQVFHLCYGSGRHDSFICPIGTIFHQRFLVCDWWYNVFCEESERYYDKQQRDYDKQQKTSEKLNVEGSSDSSSIKKSPLKSSTDNFADVISDEDFHYDDDYSSDDIFVETSHGNKKPDKTNTGNNNVVVTKHNPIAKITKPEYFGGSKPYILPESEISLPELEKENASYDEEDDDSISSTTDSFYNLPGKNSLFGDNTYHAKIPFALFQSQAYERDINNSSRYLEVPKNKIINEWWRRPSEKRKESNYQNSTRYQTIPFIFIRNNPKLENQQKEVFSYDVSHPTVTSLPTIRHFETSTPNYIDSSKFRDVRPNGYDSNSYKSQINDNIPNYYHGSSTNQQKDNDSRYNQNPYVTKTPTIRYEGSLPQEEFPSYKTIERTVPQTTIKPKAGTEYYQSKKSKGSQSRKKKQNIKGDIQDKKYVHNKPIVLLTKTIKGPIPTAPTTKAPEQLKYMIFESHDRHNDISSSTITLVPESKPLGENKQNSHAVWRPKYGERLNSRRLNHKNGRVNQDDSMIDANTEVRSSGTRVGNTNTEASNSNTGVRDGNTEVRNRNTGVRNGNLRVKNDNTGVTTESKNEVIDSNSQNIPRNVVINRSNGIKSQNSGMKKHNRVMDQNNSNQKIGNQSNGNQNNDIKNPNNDVINTFKGGKNHNSSENEKVKSILKVRVRKPIKEASKNSEIGETRAFGKPYSIRPNKNVSNTNNTSRKAAQFYHSNSNSTRNSRYRGSYKSPSYTSSITTTTFPTTTIPIAKFTYPNKNSPKVAKVSVGGRVTISEVDGMKSAKNNTHFINAETSESVKITSIPAFNSSKVFLNKSSIIEKLKHLNLSNVVNLGSVTKDVSVSVRVESKVVDPTGKVTVTDVGKPQYIHSFNTAGTQNSTKSSNNAANLEALLKAKQNQNAMVSLAQEPFKLVEKLLKREKHKYSVNNKQ